MQRTVIGLDVGHSSVKVVAASSSGRHQFLFPSVAIPAFAISDEGEARIAAMETVAVGQRKFFVGETALVQSCGQPPALGLTNDWIETPEHSALIAGAAKKLERHGLDLRNCLVVTGLPSALHTHQKARMREVVRQQIQAEVLVAPQPFGPLQTLMLTPVGTLSSAHDMREENWAVVEIGHFTTDFLLIQSGRIVEKASGSCGGVRLAVEHMQRLLNQENIQVDHFEAEQALRERRIKYFGKALDVTEYAKQAISLIASEVMDTASRVLDPVARKLDGILIAGGGAPVIFPELSLKWPHATIANEPRMAIAEGFCRFGMSISAKTQGAKEPAAA
ncbi:MAG: ParM/StbA family protein [Halothiobacillaceae bacterium]